LLEFEKIQRYLQLLETTLNPKVIEPNCEPIKILTDQVAQYLTLRDYEAGQIIYSNNQTVHEPLFLIAGKVDLKICR